MPNDAAAQCTIDSMCLVPIASVEIRHRRALQDPPARVAAPADAALGPASSERRRLK